MWDEDEFTLCSLMLGVEEDAWEEAERFPSTGHGRSCIYKCRYCDVKHRWSGCFCSTGMEEVASDLREYHEEWCLVMKGWKLYEEGIKSGKES